MSIAVTLLTALAVLVWPSVHPASPVAQGGATAGDGTARAGTPSEDFVSTDGGAQDPTRTAPGSVRVFVPVAEVAGVIELLALTLRGGVGLVEAMEAVAIRVGGPLGLHLQTVAAAGRWGVEDAMAWASVPAAWQPAARALRMAATAGVPPADALVRVAEEMRRREQQRLEVATATLGIRIVLPLGLAFLPAFVLTTVVPIVLALAQQVLVDQ